MSATRETRRRLQRAGLAAFAVALLALASQRDRGSMPKAPTDRREVVFWHFWGGQDRPVVESIVDRFNRSQDEHFVRAIAMPGQNLDLKLFLAVTGGDPPDVINQDDPIIADWAHRGAITPIDELAAPRELRQLEDWLFTPARELGSYRGRLYGLCNGLDIRALFYDRQTLARHGFDGPPESIDELDYMATVMTPPHKARPRSRFAYLPDPRRLWAWGIVFGGRFYDPQTRQITADAPEIVAALRWMASYSQRYGREEVTAFRTGEQGLTGASSPLLEGRFALLMDGQWRVREIAAAGRTAQFGVAPLPRPAGGRERAGWVNGNFFLVPRKSDNPQGAWQFMKFWSGLGHEQEAAEACVAGGWIPASQQVVDQPAFQQYLERYPLFAKFVELAGSPHQVPTPSIPVAGYFYQAVNDAAAAAMYRGADPRMELEKVTRQVQQQLDEVLAEQAR